MTKYAALVLLVQVINNLSKLSVEYLALARLLQKLHGMTTCRFMTTLISGCSLCSKSNLFFVGSYFEIMR